MASGVVRKDTEHTTENEPSALPVAAGWILPTPEICVICLDRVTEKAVALPCGHDQFDFSCLGTWLQQQRVCPLCKRAVTAIKYDVGHRKGSRIFHLPEAELPRRTHQDIRQRRLQRRSYVRSTRGGSEPLRRGASGAIDDVLEFRKQVYRRQMYSMHVGANRISRYKNVTPGAFLRDEHLVSRAKKWIRRELSVFDFLNPDSDAFGRADRRTSNAEFLLEYIVGILKSIDLKGSTGQAEELLKDFLGRGNARLFLHELEAWLRSPYENLRDWDRAVQYALTSPQPGAQHDGGAEGSTRRSRLLVQGRRHGIEPG